MLPTETASRVQDAIAAARATARAITKAGETAAQEIDTRAIRAITEARTAFLDLDDNGQEIATPTEPGRAIDLEPAKVEAMPLFSTGPAAGGLEF
jgi:4-hydroxyphenylpyruvate dioxygenase-like putative hemolysin